jgi:hypothetical protein
MQIEQQLVAGSTSTSTSSTTSTSTSTSSTSSNSNSNKSKGNSSSGGSSNQHNSTAASYACCYGRHLTWRYKSRLVASADAIHDESDEGSEENATKLVANGMHIAIWKSILE